MKETWLPDVAGVPGSISELQKTFWHHLRVGIEWVR